MGGSRDRVIRLQFFHFSSAQEGVDYVIVVQLDVVDMTY